MAFKISQYLPFLGVKKTQVAEPLTRDATIFALQWTRGPIPKERDSAESYWVSSRQYPTYSLSGPLPTNGRRVEICRPAYAAAGRQFPNASVAPANIINGQLYSQPLYDANAGGFVRSPTAINTPFSASSFGEGITPGGAA